LFYNESLETVFYHVLGSMAAELFGDVTPFSTVVHDMFDNDFILFLVPLASEIG